MAGIYGRDQVNYSSNCIVNQKPKDHTWDQLRQAQKSLMVTRAHNESIDRLSC